MQGSSFPVTAGLMTSGNVILDSSHPPHRAVPSPFDRPQGILCFSPTASFFLPAAGLRIPPPSAHFGLPVASPASPRNGRAASGVKLESFVFFEDPLIAGSLAESAPPLDLVSPFWNLSRASSCCPPLFQAFALSKCRKFSKHVPSGDQLDCVAPSCGSLPQGSPFYLA